MTEEIVIEMIVTLRELEVRVVKKIQSQQLGEIYDQVHKAANMQDFWPQNKN